MARQSAVLFLLVDARLRWCSDDSFGAVATTFHTSEWPSRAHGPDRRRGELSRICVGGRFEMRERARELSVSWGAGVVADQTSGSAKSKRPPKTGANPRTVDSEGPTLGL